MKRPESIPVTITDDRYFVGPDKTGCLLIPTSTTTVRISRKDAEAMLERLERLGEDKPVPRTTFDPPEKCHRCQSYGCREHSWCGVSVEVKGFHAQQDCFNNGFKHYKWDGSTL